MYMPKSAVPLQQTQPTAQPVAQSGYMPKTAVPVQPEKKSLGGFVKNIGNSFVNTLGGVAKAAVNVFNPDWDQNTLANIGKLATGVGQKFTPGVQKEEESANQVGQFYKDRYGGVENIKNTLYNDPVGAGLDVASVVGGVGGVAKGAGTITRVPGLVKAGSTIGKVGEAIDPLMATGKAVGAVTQPLFSKVKPAMFSKSEKMLTAGLGNPAKQARIADKAGRSVASFIDEYKLYDRNPSTAREVTKQIGSQFDEAAMGSKAKIPVQKIVDSIDSKIVELQSGTGGVISDNTANQIEELTRRKQMFIDSVTPKQGSPVTAPSDLLAKDMNSFMDNNTPTLKPKKDVLPEMQAEMSRNLNPSLQTITPGEATTFRRKVIDPDVPKSEFGLNPKDTGKAGGVKATRDIFRQEIINAVPELKKLGMDYGMAKELEKIIADAASRSSNRQLFNFTKLGSAGVGAFLGGIPGLVGGFVTEQLVNSPKFIEITSKMLRSMSQSKGVSPLFSKAGKSAYLFGKTGRMATAGQTETPKSTKEEILRPLPEAYGSIIPPSTPYKVPQIRRSR